ncbi:MAG: ZIP family metal transporter [Anaerolineae bacterium]|nr:ZIP family metal transporter [Anaerolineae bacterium]
MLSDPFMPLAIAAALAFLACTVGIWIVSRYGHWARSNSVYLAAFAAGALLTVSSLHLVPEALELSHDAGYAMLAGFLGLFALNQVMHLHIGHEHNGDSDAHHAGSDLIAVVGIGFHSLVDGVIYSVTFSVSALLGALSALGLVLHEVPEGAICYLLLHRSGYSRRKSFLGAIIAAAATTPLGAFISYPFIHRLEAPTLGLLLGVSAGALFYVGGSHLLPEVELDNRPAASLAVAAGVAVALATSLIAGGH